VRHQPPSAARKRVIFFLFSRTTPGAVGGAQARHFLSFSPSQTGALRSGLVKFLIRKT
jgi:hypothetical protein